MAKEKAVKVSETKSTELLKVPAYSDGKLVGWTQVTVFKRNEAGLKKAKDTLTLSGLDNLNRQEFTDAKNNLRRGISALAALRRVAKVNPDVDKAAALLVKRAEGVALTPDELKFMEDLLK